MNNLIEVKYISLEKGKGVIAKQFIKKDTVIDVANVVLLTRKDFYLIHDTVLWNYSFEWEDPKNGPEIIAAVSLSISQFINHSYKPNLNYEFDYENNTIIYTTIRDIKKGEELTVNYNGVPNDESPVWFDVKE